MGRAETGPRGVGVLWEAAKRFVRHNCTDLAAALTYYAVLALVPAAVALLALLGVIGEAESAVRTVDEVLRPLVSAEILDQITPTLERLATFNGAGIALVVGVAGSLLSASGYVGAFGRAMNIVSEVEETRAWWKLRPYMLLITLVAVLLNAAALLMVVLTGPVAESVGAQFGIAEDTLRIWDLAKWPVFLMFVITVVSLLYHATPNVRFGRVRFLTWGATLALLLWAIASAGFGFYVANLGSYDRTYGSIAGVVVSLLWLWLTNLALLFGAEVDAVRDERGAASAALRAEPLPEALDSDRDVTLVPAAPVEPGPIAAWLGPEVTESFPQRPGEPPYGPRVQPVPDED